MNFKKTLTIAGLASLAVVGLASCGGGDEGDYDVTLNLALSYKECYVKYNRDKVTSFKMDPTHTTLDGITLKEGKTLLPVWQKMSKNLEFNVKDVAPTGKDTATVMRSVLNNKFKGLKKANVEVLQVATGNNEYVNNVTQGNFINLEEYKDQMPNLFKFLKANPSIEKQLRMNETGGKSGIYYAPYFDGIDQIELGYNMNAEVVTALLDADEKQWDDTKKEGNRFKNAADFDTAATLATVYGGAGSGNTASYIQSLDDQTIAIANDKGEQDTIQVSFAKDIATIQNELPTKNGKTLTEALIAYINETYKVGQEGSPYKKPSDIFLGVNACYNADELIALWRCFKTNPAYLVGNADATMIPFFPRTGNTNRVNSMIKMGQMFGLRGSLAGEKDNLWFNKDGELVDSRTQEYTYAVLDKLNAIKQEGLFPSSWSYNATDGNAEFRSVVIKDGTGFMCYDYTNVTAYNAKTDSKTTQMQQVLSPVAKWPITKDNEDKDIVGAVAGEDYSYTRFSEDNRALKDGGWSLVKQNLTGKGKEAKLKKALRLMDYMYEQDGSFLEAFGTTGQDTSDKLVEKIETDANGVKYPKLTTAYIGHIAKYGAGTWHNYMTRYQGACLGIGNVRSNYLEAQNTHALQEVGMKKVAAAMKAKAMFQCTSTDSNFFQSVPTTFSISTNASSDIETNASTITTFWTINNNNNTKIAEGIVMNMIYNGWDTIEAGYKYDKLKEAFKSTNDSYLTAYAEVAGTTPATANQYPYFK